jgi:hypothetical protein
MAGQQQQQQREEANLWIGEQSPTATAITNATTIGLDSLVADNHNNNNNGSSNNSPQPEGQLQQPMIIRRRRLSLVEALNNGSIEIPQVGAEWQKMLFSFHNLKWK